ncbi:MAG: ABC transporter ATP-binding protein [Phormidesmis sp.]
MSDTIIRVENLSKKYQLSHNQPEKYVALRDVLANRTKQLKGRLLGAKRETRPDREDFWALKDVSFEVKRGDRVGIIGRNGAGKSTLLKILSRIVEPTSGSVELRGRVASLLEVGTGFHPELTGRENIFLNGSILGMSKAEITRNLDEIVSFSEVEKFLDTPVKRYSSGMYVRLAFAVAAHLEPEILVVDEVLAVGDAAFQKKCLGKMEEVGQAGRTVIFVSHNMPSVQSLCQRVIWLQEGSLQMSDKPEHIISHYLSTGLSLQEAEVDLSQHSGRSRSKEPALKRAWILNSEGLKSNSILMGSRLCICMEFQLMKALRNPAFGFGIEDEYGRRIFSLNNYMKPSLDSTDCIKSGTACFEVDCLPLLPGNYFVSLSVAGDRNTLVDFVEQAILIKVHPYDVFKSGKIPQKSHGVVFVDGHIRVYSD